MWLENTEDDTELWFRRNTGLRMKSEHIPIFVGIIVGTVLLLLLVIAYVLRRCCVTMKKKKPKKAVNIETIEKNLANSPNYSTFHNNIKKDQFVGNSRIVELIPEYDGSLCWYYKNHTLTNMPSTKENKQPHPTPCTEREQKCTTDAQNFLSRTPRPHSRSVVLSPVVGLEDYCLPQISEFSTHSYPYTCSSILDDYYSQVSSFNNFRTRSLPSYARFKKHSLSIEDSPAELYDKVNFSKKRKNRMRHDEAAVIALSKSRSQFLNNKDTDILVDNEAVIVYDERTAL